MVPITASPDDDHEAVVGAHRMQIVADQIEDGRCHDQRREYRAISVAKLDAARRVAAIDGLSTAFMRSRFTVERIFHQITAT